MVERPTGAASDGCLSMLVDDRLVREMDPLGADDLLPEALPRMNRIADTVGLARLATELVDRADGIDVWDVVGARAATRDLGFVLASMVRHGVARHTTQRIIGVLRRLSVVTQEVPRDTVQSYSSRNPSGRRRRTFSGLDAEESFIVSVSDSIEALAHCVDHLEASFECGRSTTVRHLEEARALLGAVVNSILDVRRSISPEVFTFELRPYFPPIEIGGRLYYAPGGAQLALLVVDLQLDAPERTESASHYLAYVDENAIYLPPQMRAIARRSLERRPLAAELTHRDPPDSGSLRALELIFDTVLRFRLPHLQLARANMAIRPAGALGSGGYTTTVLELLVERTRAARSRVTARRLAAGGRPTHLL